MTITYLLRLLLLVVSESGGRNGLVREALCVPVLLRFPGTLALQR